MINNKFCEECNLHATCNKYKMLPKGNKINPKIVFILPHPNLEEDQNKISFGSEEGNYLFKSIGNNISDCYFTYLVKCTPYNDPLTKEGGTRKPTKKEIECCQNLLIEELKQFQNKPILMPLGETVLSWLVPQSRFNYDVGNPGITGNFNYFPNFLPSDVMKKPRIQFDFKKYIKKALKNDINFENKERIKICNYEESLFQMDKMLELYTTKDIEYVIADFETNSLDHWSGVPIMIQFAHNEDVTAYSIPYVITNKIHHPDLPFKVDLIPWEISKQQSLKLKLKTRDILNTIPVVGHNFKFDAKYALWYRMCDLNKLNILDDTMNLAFQIYSNPKKGFLKLKNLCRMFFDVKDDWEDPIEIYLSKFSRIKDRNYGNIPTGLLGLYGGLDVFWNKHLYNFLKRSLPWQMDNITNIVNSAIKPFVEVETKGIKLDMDMWNLMNDSYTSKLETWNKEIKSLNVIQQYIQSKLPELRDKNSRAKKKKSEEDLLNEAFKITSGKDLTKLIYNKEYYGLPTNKFFLTKKKKEPQTDKKVIEFMLKNNLTHIGKGKLIENWKNKVGNKIKDVNKAVNAGKKYVEGLHEVEKFFRLLLKHKRIETLMSSYIDPVPEKKSFEGMYKPEYLLSHVITGRFSSGFHTMPRQSDIKRLYTSRWKNEGGIILCGDESQLELRILASLCGDEKYLDVFRRGGDVHRATASNVLKKPPEEITPEERVLFGKEVNFPIAYGSTAIGLAKDRGISIAEAEDIFNNLFAGYPDLKAWMKKQKNYVHVNKRVVTLFNRVIPVKAAQFPNNRRQWSEVDRVAINYPIQSAAGDLVTRALTRIWPRMKEDELKSLLIAMIHDSIDFDVYPGELFQILKMLQEECVDNLMRDYKWIKCPLVLGIDIGTSLGGKLESKVISASDDKIILKSEGLRKDFNDFELVARRAYDVCVVPTRIKELGEDYFDDDVVIKDSEFWEADVTIWKKGL